MPTRISLAVVFAALSLVLSPGAARAATGPGVDVLAVGSTSDHQVSLVAAVQPMPLVPLGSSAVTVTSGGADLPTEVNPVLSGRTAIGLVVDASAEGAPALQGGGLSGAAGFLLQLPPQASITVIADRLPPAVVAAPSIGVTNALQATSALTSDGVRATSSALTLALRSLPARSGTQRVIVLYTSAPNAGAESGSALGQRLRRAHAILAVVDTSAAPGYWSTVARSTGGLAIAARPAEAVEAFDALADALRARYLVKFPRPGAGGQVSLRIDAAGRPVTVAVALPAPGSAGASSAAGSGSRLSGPWLWALVAAGLLAVGGLVIVVRRRRLRKAKPDHGSTLAAGAEAEIVRQPVLPGVRVFDVAHPGDPREITNSLFEPRIERDLREGAPSAGPSTAKPSASSSPLEGAGQGGTEGSFEIPRARGQEAEDRGS